jgi:hypothetical protein
MSYHIERNPTGESVDIVINGFENGIAASPYGGIADMRGVNITTIPGEAMCNFSTSALTLPPTVSSAAFTAATGTNIFTWTSTATLYKGLAIQFNSLSGGTAGVSTGVVYYVTNVSGSTFQVASAISYAGTVTPITITANISGTFSTYTIGTPLSSCNDSSSSALQPNIYFIDSTNAAWWITGVTALSLFPVGTVIFLGNIGSISSWSGNGIIAYHGYLFIFRYTSGTGNVDYASISGLISTVTPASSWTYSWKTFAGTSLSIDMRPIVGQDDTVYWGNGSYVASLFQNPGTGFNPGTSSTYTYNVQALPILSSDIVTCIGELGQTLLIGGVKHFVYPWDRVSIGYNAPLVIPENYTSRIVTANNNAYIFAGNRGRIYITNGSGIDDFKKIPDYVSGTIQPYYIWGDATYWHNQLVFTLGTYFYQNQGYQNDGSTPLTTMNAVWEIDVMSEALRCTLPLSFGTYSGYAPMIAPNVNALNPAGEGLFIGWNNGSPGIDSSIGAPYSGRQTIIDSDMIPVGLLTTPYTPSQVEWKTSYPIGANGTSETVALYWRTDLSQSFSLAGTTTNSTAPGQLSDIYPAGFEKAQWVQIRAVLTSNATTPTYTRLKEFRIRSSEQGQSYVAAIQNASLG